jgi:tight adherence protein B
MITYILYFSIFVAAFLLFEFAASTYSARRQRKRAQNRRMALFQENLTQSQVSAALKLERGIDSDWGARMDALGLKTLYIQSGMTTKFTNLLLICLAVGAGLALLSGYFGAPLWLQAALVLPISLGLAWFVLSRMRSRRIDKFTRQLPDALDVIVRSLYAGHPFGAAVNLVGREMPDPAGSEFGLLADELSYGIPADIAMDSMMDRVGAGDLRYFTITLNIHRQSGGNLGEILHNLSDVIRQRYLMKAKIRSLSAEGRFSAKLLSVFPLIIYLVIKLLAPRYFDPIWEGGFEVYFFGFCIVMTLIGNYVINKMVNFDF